MDLVIALHPVLSNWKLTLYNESVYLAIYKFSTKSVMSGVSWWRHITIGSVLRHGFITGTKYCVIYFFQIGKYTSCIEIAITIRSSSTEYGTSQVFHKQMKPCKAVLARATKWEYLNNSTEWWPLFHQRCGGGGGGNQHCGSTLTIERTKEYPHNAAIVTCEFVWVLW